MAWVTTETDVASTLIVRKSFRGLMVPGYPKTYSLLAAFDSYPAVTVNDWHKMETDPREERIEAFKTYVNNAESIDVDDTAINDMYRASPETPDEIAEL